MEGICKVCGYKGKVVRHHISYEKDITVLFAIRAIRKRIKTVFRFIDLSIKTPRAGIG